MYATQRNSFILKIVISENIAVTEAKVPVPGTV